MSGLDRKCKLAEDTGNANQPECECFIGDLSIALIIFNVQKKEMLQPLPPTVTRAKRIISERIIAMVEWKIKGIYKADANAVYNEITSIGENVKPSEIVEYARDENTELHKLFTWDDTVAAERWRENEARCIIRNIVIVKNKNDEDEDKKPIVVRAIVSTSERMQEYTTIQRVVKNPDAYERLLASAVAELKAFKRKYETLSGDLSEVFEAIDMVC